MAEVTSFRNNALPYPVYGVAWAVVFPLLDADGDPVSPSSPDSERSLNGDTFADCTNEAVEIATSSGICYLLLTAAEMTADIVTVRIQSTGAKTTVITLYPRKLPVLATGTCQGANDTGDIQLASGDSAIDDNYNGCLIVAVIDGTTESRIINDYVGSTKVAEIAPAWNTAAPDSNDTYTIYLPEGRQVSPVNVTHAAGVAWASGAITAAVIATDAIDADAIADNAINAGAIASDAITAAKIAADAITAAKLASDVTTEIQSGLATQASVNTIDDFLDTEIAAIKAKTDSLTFSTANRVDAQVVGMDVNTITNDTIADDAITAGAIAGDAITAAKLAADAITANALAADAVTEIQSGLATAANQTTILAKLNGLCPVSGTIGATGNDTTHLHLAGLTYADNDINSMTLVIQDVSTGLFYSRWIEDWANTGDLATVATLPFTPQASTDLYWILPFRSDVTGGSGLDAAGVRAAIGLASANLDTQLSTIDDFLDTEVAAIKAKTDNLPSDPADASDIASSFTTVNTKLDTIDDFLDTEIAAIKAKTDNLPSDPADASDIASSFTTVNTKLDTIDDFLDTEVAAIKAKTDNLPASPANEATLTTIASYIDTEVAAIKAKTDNLPTDPADQSAVEAAITAATSPLATQASVNTIDDFLDTEIAAIKAKTDSLTFTVTGKVDSNITHVNETEVAGTGGSGDEWGPA